MLHRSGDGNCNLRRGDAVVPCSVSLQQNGNRAADNLDTAGGHNDEHERFVAHFLDNLRRFTKGKSLLDRVM